MGEVILLKKIPNRNGFNPSSINFPYGYDTIGRNTLAHLPTCRAYHSVVFLNEFQQLSLFRIWIQRHQAIFQRHNLEILSAEIQDVILALPQFPGAFLEFLRSQYFLLASLLDRGKFLTQFLAWKEVVCGKFRTLRFILPKVNILELVNRLFVKSLLAHNASRFKSPRWTWKNQFPAIVNV